MKAKENDSVSQEALLGLSLAQASGFVLYNKQRYHLPMAFVSGLTVTLARAPHVAI